MAKRRLGFQFNPIGIASALDQFDLTVPPNQRSYAWEDPDVRTLFEDFSSVITSDSQTSFVSTIVLTHRQNDKLEVTDGQQRLATTSMLFAAIRDHLYQYGGHEKQAAELFLQQVVERDKLRFFAVLHILPIISAQDAVRPTIVQEHRTDNPFS